MPAEVVPLNTVWIVMAAILVFFMQAGFALVESGLVRAKNAVNVIMKNYSDMCVGAIGFWAIGYGLMFGSNPTGWIGTSKFGWATLNPWEYSLLFFQIMFSATSATIVSGALAERIRFSSYLIGSLVITTLLYPTFGGWVWNENGWLKKLGFLDFSGGTVVHSVGAWCALAGIIVLGPRTGRFAKDGTPREIPGHNLPFVALGGFILWFGWFGFNTGSTMEASANLGKIALNTHLSGSAAAAFTIVMHAVMGKPPLLGSIINGSLGGLVAITAGCLYVSPGAAVMIGCIAAMIVPLGNKLLERLRLDDAVGAIPVHGLCGIWGTLAIALFKGGSPDGQQFLIQLAGVGVAFAFVFPIAVLMYVLISGLMPLRVNTVDEQRGLDFSEHNEVGYPDFQDTLLHADKTDYSLPEIHLPSADTDPTEGS
ncbi:MAG: ammonium transporter [Fimbriiglobus sp.]